MKKRFEKDGVWAYDDNSDARLGPPETILSLSLTNSERRKLMEDLIDQGFLNARDMIGRRGDVKKLAQKHNIDHRLLLHLYQSEFYGEN